MQDYASAEEALHRYLRGKEQIDGVFSIKNEITVNAYKILRAAKLAIPHQVALVGFDEFDLADALDPPICVVRQPVKEIGAKAAEMLFAALDEGTRLPEKALQLRVELVHRASCGA